MEKIAGKYSFGDELTLVRTTSPPCEWIVDDPMLVTFHTNTVETLTRGIGTVQADVVLVPQIENAKRYKVDMVRQKHTRLANFPVLGVACCSIQ